MRLALCLSLLLAPIWAADQTADRASIDKVISTLNSSPSTPGLFTDDFADFSVLKNLGFSGETQSATNDVHVGSQCVSHEPWGELAGCRITQPATLVIESLRWVTPDVALVETSAGVGAAAGAAVARSWPAMLVLRKTADGWKIASIRVVLPRGPAGAH